MKQQVGWFICRVYLWPMISHFKGAGDVLQLCNPVINNEYVSPQQKFAHELQCDRIHRMFLKPKMKSQVNHPTLKNAVGITTFVLIIAFNVTIKL